MGRQCYTLIGSLREPADVGGYPYPVHGEQPYMAVMPPKWAQDCQHGQWVLFIDELTTCPPAVQAALLGVIAENRVGDSTLPEYVWIAGGLQSAGLRGQRFRVGAAAGQPALPPDLGNRRGGVAAGHEQRPGLPAAELRALPADWEKCIGRNTALVGPSTSTSQGCWKPIPRTGPRHPGLAHDPLLDQCGHLRRGPGSDRRRAALALSGQLPVAWARRRRWSSRLGSNAWTCPTRRSGSSRQSCPGPCPKCRWARELHIPPRCDQVMAILGAGGPGEEP